MRSKKFAKRKELKKKTDKAVLQRRRRRWLRSAKPVIFCGCLMLSILVLLGSTMAWFTSADEVENRMKRSEDGKEFAVVAVDEFNKEPNGDHVYEKRVGANNVGDIAAFVRLLVLPVFKSEDGHLFPAVLGKAGDAPGDPPVPPDANVIIDDFNLATWNGSEWTGGDWVDGGDGYFYYLHRLEPGESTDTMTPKQNLFNNLYLVNPMPEGYSNSTLKVEVKCEAVEVNNYREAWWLLAGNAAPASPPIPAGLLTLAERIDGALYGQID